MSPTQDPDTERFEFRPAWSYQWLAIAGILLSSAALGVVAGSDWLPLPLARMTLAALGALAAYIAALVLYRRYAWHYTVDPERLDSRHGLVARTLRSVRVGDLRNIYVRQTLGQRLFGVGDVDFCGADNAVELTFYGVPDPMGLRNQIQSWQTGTVSRVDESA
jgi:membrane protein YdbS with pleckstrin-like domain